MTDFSEVVSAVQDARVQLDDNGSYSIIIHFANNDSNISILPLYLNGRRTFSEVSIETVFDHMTIRDLSELFIVKKNDELRIIKIHVHDMPTEERNDAIISLIIDSKPKFLQYILYLLSEDPELATLEIGQLIKEGTYDGKGKESLITPSIYEKMLLAAARDPEKIKAIKDIMAHVETDKIDDEFRKLVECFDCIVGE